MKRIPSLDGLRAISVLLVIVGHLADIGNAPKLLHVYSNTGVRMFFVISGYLITTLLLNEHARTSTIHLREFYIRRAYRILPAAAVFSLVAIVGWWHEFRWIDIGAVVFYLVNYDEGRPWVVIHLWSLAVEEQFYLLWPSVMRAFFRHKVRILIGVIVVSPFYSAICYHFKVPRAGYFTFPAVAGNLAIGCLLAVFADKIPTIRGWMALLMVTAAVLIPQFSPDSRTKTLLQLFVLWPLLNGSLAGILWHVVQRPYRILNLAPVVWLGKVSYSLYLWQEPFCGGPTVKPRYYVLFALGCACLSYYLVEQPVLRLREKRAARLMTGAVLRTS